MHVLAGRPHLHSSLDVQVVVVQYDLAEGASPSPPAPDAPAEDAVEVTVPVLSFTARVTSYIPANFTASVQEQYIAAIKGAVPTGAELWRSG